MITAHSQFRSFYNRLLTDGDRLFSPWAGDVFRSAVPRWVSRPYRLTGVGAVLTGGRWNVRHLVPAVCFSTSALTVAAEADAKANRFGWTPADLHPQTRIILRVELQVVLDLTNEQNLESMSLDADELTECDWQSEQAAGREALTQAVARAVFERLGEGLVVPSARERDGVNVIHFPNHRRDRSKITAYHEENIPFVHGL